MEWCETDPDLIMTGGRDNRVVCWNYTQEEGPISAYDLDNPVFDIKWSKKLKSIYALSL
jgi:protein transport protein SEC31